jgi:hypothetical protein
MKLNYPKLSLPEAEETVAYAAVVKVLEHDPVLRSTTKLFLAWKGDVEDLWEPSVATCPFLRVSPGGAPSNWESEGQHKMPISLTVEAAIVGSDVRQMMNYWACIRRALWPQGDTAARDRIHAIFQAARINRPIISSPAYGVIEIGEARGGPRITLATGSIKLNLLINTP